MDVVIRFETQLIASAPKPRAEFENELAQRLTREWTQRHRAKAMLMPARQRRFGRLSARAAILLSALLVVGVGIVLAVSGVLQQILGGYDPGLKAVLDQGLGHEIGISQTIGDFTTTLEWAYADGNRLTLAYEIAGRPGKQYTNLDSYVYTLTLRDTGEVIPFYQGMGALLDANGDVIMQPRDQIPTSDHSLIIRTYDLSAVALGDRTSLDLHLETDIWNVTLQKRTALPIEQFDEMQERPPGHFSFDFSVPLVNDQRTLAAKQTATDQGITLTLERVTVSPSQTRVVVCYAPPDPARQWTSIPQLTTSDGDVPGGGGVLRFEDGDRTCDDFTYHASLYDYRGEWQLKIGELVGMGSGGGADQQRIAGSWAFPFIIP